MRTCAAAILLALLAPAVLAIVNAPAAQCQLAPCCIGKSTSCPMHRTTAANGLRLTCVQESHDAVLPLAVLPLAVLPGATSIAAPLRAPLTIVLNIAIADGGNAPLPDVPPPQRLA
ncbi:MAG: hypothetical protein JO197_04370 [Acidobacteria bacterium]|nr:hypothetical protein [Acidobacteriota bacterium]MBV9478550.1 hypothetical protein [Acidobacteriota bacterium]